jgi:hypothetical protein
MDTIFDRFKDDPQKGRLIEALAMMVWQHCQEVEKGVYMSKSLSANACAMEELVSYGVANCIERHGRWAKIKFNVEVFP